MKNYFVMSNSARDEIVEEWRARVAQSLSFQYTSPQEAARTLPPPSAQHDTPSSPTGSAPNTPPFPHELSPVNSPILVPETPETSQDGFQDYEELPEPEDDYPYISSEQLIIKPKSLAESFECNICYSIVREPRTLGKCDHLHCLSCIISARIAKRVYRQPKDDYYECSKCRLKSKEVFPAYMVKSQLSELMVRFSMR